MYGWVEDVSHSPASPSLMTWGLIGCGSVSAHKSLCLVKGDHVCPRQCVKIIEVSQLTEKDLLRRVSKENVPSLTSGTIIPTPFWLFAFDPLPVLLSWWYIPSISPRRYHTNNI